MRLIIAVATLALLISGCAESGDIRVIKLSPRDMVEQIRLGDIDAFVAWEPFVSEAVVKGYGKVVASSEDIWPNHPCCVVAVRKGVNDSVLEALLWAHVKATRFINNESNSEKVIRYAEEFTGMDEEVVREAMKRIKFIEFPDVSEFRKYYLELKKGGYLTKSIGDLGYRSEDEFFSDFLYSKTYDRVAQKLAENESWKPVKVNVKLRIGYLTADLHQLAFYVALREGYFNEVGINVEKKEYANGVYEMEGFKLREIDAGYLGSAPATLKRINDGVDIRIVAGVNSEGSAIVARDAGSVRDLAGKKVAIPGFGTVQDFLLRMAAERAGIGVTT